MNTKTIAPVLSLLLLGGCYSDQKQQLAACILRAQERTAPANNADVRDMEISDATKLCMQASGYELVEDSCPTILRTESVKRRSAAETYAELGKRIVAVEQLQRSESLCYQPMNWLGKHTLQFELWLGL